MEKDEISFDFISIESHFSLFFCDLFFYLSVLLFYSTASITDHHKKVLDVLIKNH